MLIVDAMIQSSLLLLELVEQRLPQVQAFDGDVVAQPALGRQDEAAIGRRAAEGIEEVAGLTAAIVRNDVRAGAGEVGPKRVVCLSEDGRERAGIDEHV